MENQLLNCLLANLIGLGKQLLPQGQAGLTQEGQASFFDILSLKMGGTDGASASAIPGFMADPGDGAGAAETDDTGHGPVAASLDSEDLSILVSSLISAMDSTVVADKPADVKNAADIEDFLRGILEVLSGGDEIELKIPEATGTTAVLPGEEGTEDTEAESAKQFMGCLASVLLGLDRMVNAGSSETETVAAATDDLPAPEVEKPDPSAVKTVAQKAVADTVVHEDQEAPVFVVEVVKAAKKGDQDLSPGKDTGVQAAAAGVAPAEDSGESKDNLLILAARRDAGPKDGVEPEKIVIRVRETEETEVDPSGDNRIIPQNDSSGQRSQQVSSETKGVVRNDFGAAMVDKIERLAEQYAGKGMNMDMVVKLRIDDTETVLVGLREEGNSVTVEVKTANENTMNFIQSQKDDLIKNLENKNIFTTIHVDINQDQQGKQQQRNDHAKEDGDPKEQQDFGAFFEALV